METSRHPGHVGATLRLLACAISALVPIRYMIIPPTVPEQGGLCAQDEHGIYHPLKMGWLKRDTGLPWKEVLELLVILSGIR